MNKKNDPDLYLEPVDDGLVMRESGEWVLEKLHFVKRYIDMFTTSMSGKPWRNVRFIDLFSGPGKCEIRETDHVALGSPLLALTARKPFTECIFVDLKAENLEALQKRCSQSQTTSRLRYYQEDANKKALEIADEIIREDAARIPGQWQSLNLAFLDPEGLELEWETVAALATVGKMDLIIHYSQSGLTRNLDNLHQTASENVIDKFFGDRHWRNIYDAEQQKGKGPGQVHSALIEYYRSKLAPLGYVDVRELDPGPLIRIGKSKAPGYRLLFACKHELGNKFWKEVTKKDVYGQRSLFD